MFFTFNIFKNKIPPKKAESFSQFLVIENFSQDWDSDLDSANPGPQHYTVENNSHSKKGTYCKNNVLSVPLCLLQFPVDFNKLCDLSLLNWPLFRAVYTVDVGGGKGSAVRKNLQHWALKACYDTAL